MKKLYISLFLLNSLLAGAQSTITTTSQIGYVTQLAVTNASQVANIPIATSGTGVTWDCSALTPEAGTPTINFTVMSPAGTMYASDYPTANWYFTDPALTAVIGHTYYNLSADSMVQMGRHVTGSNYEIYDNGELEMSFPMAYNQTVNNTYSKTNYLANGSVSSYQTGDITLTYEGNGTLILPSATYTDVAKLKSVRTNSLGPTTTSYLWVKATTGEWLLQYDGNGTPSATHKTGAPAGVKNFQEDDAVYCTSIGIGQILIRSAHTMKQVDVFSVTGQRLLSDKGITSNEYSPKLSHLPAGVYLLLVETDKGFSRKKITLY